MKLSGVTLGITPSTGAGNWFLEGVSTSRASIQEVWGGGEVTTSTAMRTRIARNSAVGTGTRTAGPVQRLDQTATTPGNAVFFSTLYGTTPPTILTGGGALFSASWNANGGLWRWLAAPGEEFDLAFAAGIECRADLGTGASSYGVIWTEF